MELDSSGEKSEFNSVVAFMCSVRTLFDGCISCMQNEDLYSWYKLLLSAEVELWYYMTPDQKTESRNKLSILSASLGEDKTRLALSKGKAPTNPALFHLLADYEKFLKQVWCKAGFEMKGKDDPGKALKG